MASIFFYFLLLRLQEAKLKVLQKLLQERERKNNDLNAKRLDKLWSKKQEQKERKFDKIRTEHIKSKGFTSRLCWLKMSKDN